MKKQFSILALLVSILFQSVAFSQDKYVVDGVVIPRNLDFEGKSLQLSGFGSRSKMFMEVYTSALYLTTLIQDPEEIMRSESNMAIRIQITSELVSSEKLTRNFEKGFERSTDKNIGQVKTRMEQLRKMLEEKIERGDVFNFFYSEKNQALMFYKNNVLKGSIPGIDFKRIFFGIWLSNDPVNEKLKNSLLGI